MTTTSMHRFGIGSIVGGKGTHTLGRSNAGSGMRVVIVYESMYGTNQMIAEAIADGMGPDAAVTIVEAKAAPAVLDADLDLVVVGGPNHTLGLPTPSTRASAAADRPGAPRANDRGLREWLADLRLANHDQRAAVWDTRMASPRILDAFDRCAGTIAKRLRRCGARLIDKPRKYYSADGVGALVAGEEDRARTWGAELTERVRQG